MFNQDTIVKSVIYIRESVLEVALHYRRLLQNEGVSSVLLEIRLVLEENLLFLRLFLFLLSLPGLCEAFIDGLQDARQFAFV